VTGTRGGNALPTAPERVSASHDAAAFNSGNDLLDGWLRSQALRSEGASARTYVVCEGSRIVGFYSLAAGSVGRAGMPTAKMRRGPDPMPVVIIGRLAVDVAWRGRGLGSALLRDALSRTVRAADTIGVRAILVHAIDEAATEFYRRYGFVAFPPSSRTLFLAIETAAGAEGP